MPWTLVEDCSAPIVDRLGNRKITLHAVASGILIAPISQQSASCSSVNHAMFAVEGPNHQTSEAKSVWAGRFVLLLVQSKLSPCSHVHQLPGADVRANCICAIMRCKMESELKFNAFNPLPHLFAGENVVDV